MYAAPSPSRGEPPLAFVGAAASRRLQRSSGRAAVRFQRRSDGRTVLADLAQSAPCRALLPRSDDLPTAVFATTCGGLTGGDAVGFDFSVEAGAAACATTQAAERVYRARADDAPATVESLVTVGAKAYAEWLPQETIVFDGGKLARRTVFDLADDASLLACELRVLGRAAHGETVHEGSLADRIELRRDGRLEWLDILRLSDETIAGASASACGFGGHGAVATVLYAAPSADGELSTARAILADVANAKAAATAFPGLVVVRVLATTILMLRQAVARFVKAFRAHLGRAPIMPRFWSL